ncbi:MAG TPA: TonB family protein [Alphaproteobacteria bacterium]
MHRLDSLWERQLAIGAALSLLLNVSAFCALAMAFHPASEEELEVVPVELVSLPAAAQQAFATEEREPARPEAATSKPPEQPAELTPPAPDRLPSQWPKAVEPEPEASLAELPAELPVPVPPPKVAQETPRPKPRETTVPAAEGKPDRQATAPAEATAAPIQEAAASPSVAHIDMAAMKNALGQYASRLHGLIEAHKSYPAQALMRREEGTVVLRIVIEHDGKLVDVSVLSGSPSRLVEASVQATKAAAPFPSLPSDINLPRATFELPITFRLQ